MGVAILVGMPASLRSRVERHVGRRVVIRVIPMKQDGGLRLESPPEHAVTLLDKYAESAPSYVDVVVLLLPYSRIPEEISNLSRTQAELGARVFTVEPNACIEGYASKWPARSPRIDTKFLDELMRATSELLDRQFPIPQEEDNRQIACRVIRGLAVHSKMGPNNHSHEDDLWKGCQDDLGPGGRAELVAQLMRGGILDRKKNDSVGGKGWVYWIADVERAKAFCPHLAPYFA